MKAVLAAGGTAGHINPALAIANEIMLNQPDSEIVFIGREDGMEKKLVEQAGYKLIPLETHGFKRELSFEAIAQNINAVRCAILGQIKCGRFYKEFKPDIVIGCGGYVSGPVVQKAAKMKIKTVVQEQNSFPGVTTKLLSRQVDKIFVANEEAAKRIGFPEKCVVAGNPVKAEFFTYDRQKIRKKWGIGDKVCILSFGGSLGARTINEISAKLMLLNKDNKDVYHVHAMGQYATESFPKLLEEYGLKNSKNIRVEEFISDMPECCAAADIIISRSGAITVSEIAAAGRASVLIPSPNVTENHQYYNALTLVNADAALVYEENDIDTDKVAKDIFELEKDRQCLKLMGVNARALAVPNTSKRIYENIVKLIDFT